MWGGGPESDVGLGGAGSTPAQVPSPRLGWREGVGLPGRREGAGVSAIDRLSLCREAFRPASASHQGREARVGGRRLGFPISSRAEAKGPPLTPRSCPSARLAGLALELSRKSHLLLTPLLSCQGCNHSPPTPPTPSPLSRDYVYPVRSNDCMHLTCLWPLGPYHIGVWNILIQMVPEVSHPSHPQS